MIRGRFTRLAALGAVYLAGCNLGGPAATHPRAAGTAAPTPGDVTPTATSATSTPAAPVSHAGQVLGADGKPAAGVTVRGYLVAVPGALADGAASDAAASGATAAAQGVQPIASATTDADGRFTLTSPHGEPMNVEATQSDKVKAIALAITRTDGLVLKLADVGSVTGRLAPSTGTELAGAEVFIAGTPYAAQTDATGSYTLTGVPAGTFSVDAHRSGLGTGEVTGVVVSPDQAAKARDLVLVAVAPVVTSLAPANGGPGLQVTLKGEQLGGDLPVSVSFGGIPAASVTRQDDHTVVAAVPAGAQTGNVVLAVDGVPGKPLPFRVLASLHVANAFHDFVPGEHHQLWVSAVDTNQQPVPSPVVSFKLDSTGAVDVDAHGALTARAAGAGELTVASGDLAATDAFSVHTDAVVVSTLAGHPTDGVVDRDPKVPPVYEGVGSDVELGRPYGVAVGADGNLYLADFNGWVTRVTPDGVVSKLVTLAGARAIAPTTDGALYVAAGNAIVKVSLDGHVTPFVGGSAAGKDDGTGATATFNGPLGLAVAPSGTLYVHDSGNGSVRAVTPAGVVTTLAGVSVDTAQASGSGQGPIACGPDGTLYLGTSNGFLRVDLTNPASPVPSPFFAPEPRSSPPEVSLGAAAALAVDAHGNVIWADPGEESSYLRETDMSDPANPRRITLAGYAGYYGHLTADGAGDKAGFQTLTGIARDPKTGYIYLTEQGFEQNQEQLRRVVIQGSPTPLPSGSPR